VIGCVFVEYVMFSFHFGGQSKVIYGKAKNPTPIIVPERVEIAKIDLVIYSLF
jgi:hypothetical protein